MATRTATPTTGHHGRPRLGSGAVVALVTTVIGLMLLAFLTPAIHSGAHDLPLAVAGPAPAVAQIGTALETTAPGAYEVTTYADQAQVQEAIRNRDAIGGLVLAPERTTVITASGAGAPYAAALKGLGAGLSAQGQKVTYVEVAPMTADDPAGVGITALGLPLIFGGMATAVLLATQVHGSAGRRLAAALAIAVLGGLVATLILQPWFGAIAGSFWLTWEAVSLGMTAISLTVLGLESLWGYAGLALGALVMLFVANPLSGLATGPQWLPSPWGALGQLLPVGAAGTAIRSAAYFDGHGATAAWLTLTVWALLGAALTAWGVLRRREA